MIKMGESQIIDFFSTYFRETLKEKHGKNASYTLGNFSGSQDRKFADFFAGTKSHNILIEFKEVKKEYKAEMQKPLRNKLCLTLDSKLATVSRLCHFIGWGKRQTDIEIQLNAYIDLVCSLWGTNPILLQPQEYNHTQFVFMFTKGAVGVDHETFMSYIEHLNKIAGGSARGREVPFRSILYSRNNKGTVIGTRFENLGQLNELRTMKAPRPFSSGPHGSGMSP